MLVRACLTAMALLWLPPALAQGCAPTDKACLNRVMRSHPVRQLGTWRADLARPLQTRVGAAPPALLDYLTLDNISHGYPQRPRPAVLEPDFLADVQAAIAELPPQIWRLFGERLIGVYFVEDLGGTGFTDAVTDQAGNRVAGYVVLDAAVLRRLTANAWATWKEGTPFRLQEGYTLAARIEDAAGDNRRNAIQYILLHELGHVLSIGNGIHPPWELAPRDVPAGSYPYFELSWSIDRRANRYTALAGNDFPQRRSVAYYFGAKLAASDMVATYASLEQTNFPSLYAATQPGDDFAEAFASYVHAVVQRRPWQITLSRNGETVKVFKACWDEPRCGAKRKLLEALLGR